jgi:hypothetical protein
MEHATRPCAPAACWPCPSLMEHAWGAGAHGLVAQLHLRGGRGAGAGAADAGGAAGQGSPGEPPPPMGGAAGHGCMAPLYSLPVLVPAACSPYLPVGTPYPTPRPRTAPLFSRRGPRLRAGLACGRASATCGRASAAREGLAGREGLAVAGSPLPPYVRAWRAAGAAGGGAGAGLRRGGAGAPSPPEPDSCLTTELFDHRAV